MRRLPLALPLGLAVLGLGCATTAPPPSSTFPFEIEGVTYEIVTARTASEPANDLLLRDGPVVLLRARDRDQDGSIDTVLVGDLALAEADAIYARGIEEARARGAFAVRAPARMYVLSLGASSYAVWSVASGGSEWSNRFVRYGPGGQPGPIYSDADADGQLDDAPAEVQALYEHALEAGRREEQIEVVGSRYHVRVTSAPI